MAIRSGRPGEDAEKINSNWDNIFGTKHRSIIIEELTEDKASIYPFGIVEPDSGIWPYEMQRKMSEHLYKFKEEPTAEQKQEFWKLQSYHYGL